MDIFTNLAEYKDLAITKKFHYLSEVNNALCASIETTKKYLESIKKFLLSVKGLIPTTTLHH